MSARRGKDNDERTGERAFEYELPPQPSGPMPTDGPEVPKALRWNQKRWEVYCLLHQGMTSKEAAAASGSSQYTVQEWRMKWRRRFGPDFDFTVVHDPEAARTLTSYARPEPRNAQEAATQAAEDLTRISGKARNLIWEWLQDIATDPGRISMLSAQEVKLIEQIARNAETRVQEIARDQGQAASVTGKKGASIFAGFAISDVEPSGVQEVLVGLRGALSSFRQSHERPTDEEVIELNGGAPQGG